MKRRVLIVHPDPNMILAIEDLLGELSESEGYDLSVMRARSRPVAEERARNESIHLVITALEMAADDKSPVGAGEQRRLGMELVRTLRTNMPGLAVIIVTGHVDEEVSDFTQSAGMRLAREGEKFADRLKSAVTQLLGPHQPDTPQRVVLSISLFKDRCTYQFQPEGGDARVGQTLPAIGQEQLKSLAEWSRDVDVGEKRWIRTLKLVGEELAQQLFYSTPANIAFSEAFHEWAGKVGIENIRVRFTMEDDDLHPIAVEAIKPRKDHEHWMLRNAIYRGQEPHGGGPASARPGLFQDDATSRGPISFLIIDADVPPNAIVKEGDLDLTLDPLPKLEEEVKAVEGLLLKLKAAGGPIGEVRIIRPADVPADGSFKELIENTLRDKKRKWHVLHYAGHTHYDAEHRLGYLFFPRGGIRPVEPVRIAEFALWLDNADTRFVFLSSCESAGQDFIYQLVKEHVPAIMGFMWKVNDALAREYAQSFYAHLLDGGQRSLEYACLAAKKDMYANYAEDPIWASPVLVMQVSV